MQQLAYINTTQMDDIIRDSNGNKITGGTFGIKCSRYVLLYKYQEVDKHIISKID